MVKICQEMLLNHTRHTKRRTNESTEQYLRRLTHVYLQECNIDDIDNLSQCRTLSVLYLYNNKITEIKNLAFASNLTHLYLQKNKITRIAGLNHLQRLTKLYIGHNAITVVEGLDSNVCLSELHIEHQQLAEGEKLLFDPRTLSAIAGSLTILNVSGNNIDQLHDLKVLRKLNHLVADNNQLGNWIDLSETLFEWKCLSKLEVQGNPLCDAKKWRDKLIIMSKSLISINKKDVTESTRLFVQSWYAKKEERRRSKQFSNSSSQALKSSKSKGAGLHERNSDGYMLTQHHSSLGQFVTTVHTALNENDNNNNNMVGYVPTAVEREFLPPLEQVQASVSHLKAGGKTLPPIAKVASENRLSLRPSLR